MSLGIGLLLAKNHLADRAARAGAACLVLLLYFLPTFTAFGGSHHNAAAIFVINLFLGGSFVGRVVALA